MPTRSKVAQTNQVVQVSVHTHKVVDLQSAQCHAQKMLCATNKLTQPTTKSVPAAPTTTTSVTQAVQAVFAQINQQRAGAGLPALTWSTQLVQSAHNHNLVMVAADQLSHQLPDEADLGTRITRTGLVWSSVAENIGTGTGQSAQSMALALNQSMFAEQPPDDGHRLNILSQNTLIGVDVIVDGSGRVWLTEDFGRPLS
ncbi:CAP domain-containing protein [Ktedonobacteria bacterium brp13]|nr:CAP domain-containing protein [Ktedonobacteria bacterium brp13]